MRFVFARLSIAERDPLYVAQPERKLALASDIKAYAVRRTISLEAKVGSQHLRELGGMPRFLGRSKLPGVDDSRSRAATRIRSAHSPPAANRSASRTRRHD